MQVNYVKNFKSNIYTARFYLKTYLLKRSVFTLGVIMDLFSLSRSDKTLYLKRRLLDGWSRL